MATSWRDIATEEIWKNNPSKIQSTLDLSRLDLKFLFGLVIYDQKIFMLTYSLIVIAFEDTIVLYMPVCLCKLRGHIYSNYQVSFPGVILDLQPKSFGTFSSRTFLYSSWWTKLQETQWYWNLKTSIPLNTIMIQQKHMLET